VKDDQVSDHQTNDYKFGSHTPKLSNQNTAYIEYSKCSAWSFYEYTTASKNAHKASIEQCPTLGAMVDLVF
jgi:hypothetical protein